MDARGRETIAAELRATAQSQGWSPWQLTQSIHDKAECPTLLMAWRLSTGLTQTEVSRGVQGLAADRGTPCAPGPNAQQLSRWENGHEPPGPFYRPLLGLWFRAPLERLGLAEADPLVTLVGDVPTPTQEDDVDRRHFLSLAAATPIFASLDATRQRMDTDLRRVLPQADIDHWWDVTNGHVATYGRIPPSTLLERLAPDLDEVAALAERYPHQRDLHLVASRLCSLTGAVHTDLDHDRPSREWLHTAQRYADLSGDTTQRYWVAMAQAMSAMYAPNPTKVLRIAVGAREQLGNTPNAPAAQLTGLSARAHAQLGRTKDAAAELERARNIIGRLDRSQVDEEFFGFPEREMAMYRSQILSRIGGDSAWDAQSLALTAYPADDTMDRPLILLDRARYLTTQDEPDEAAKTAGDAITSLPASMRVPLLIRQAREVGDHIATRSPSAATNFMQRIFA